MSNNLPKVSIIIPYKEDRGWLDDALKSVYTQTYQGKIEVIIAKSNNSVSFNLNDGIKRATGDYIKYLCEDDLLTPNSITDSINCMGDYDFINGKAKKFFQDGRVVLFTPPILKPNLEQLAQVNTINGGTLMYRKSVFDKVGFFDESLDCAEEYEFNLRCLSFGLRLGYCDNILYRYRRHNTQKSLGMGVDQKIRILKIEAIQNKYKVLL